MLLGTALVAALLAAERLGLDLPFLWMPGAIRTPDPLARLFAYVAISLAGLIQGAAMLAVVFVAAVLARRVAPAFLGRTPHATARSLDARLDTDRFTAALEAKGPLRPVVARFALGHAPADGTLAPPRPGRLHKWLTVAAALLALLVALSPGSMGGEPGLAPAPGNEVTTDTPLRLLLLGESKTFRSNEPVPVQVVAEARAAVARDRRLEVSLAFDHGSPQPTGRSLFLPAGKSAEDAVVIDLWRYAAALEPGEHVAVAHAGGVESNEYRFEIEAPPGPEQKDERNDPPQPKPQPPAGKEPGADPELDRRFVEPLVRDGEKVKKKARVPIEVPGGAPQEATLEEAWPELLRRREAALNRPGLAPHVRSLVREYFERLRPVK